MRRNGRRYEHIAWTRLIVIFGGVFGVLWTVFQLCSWVILAGQYLSDHGYPKTPIAFLQIGTYVIILYVAAVVMKKLGLFVNSLK